MDVFFFLEETGRTGIVTIQMGIIFAVEDVGLVAAARMLRGGGQVLIGTSAGGDGF